MSTRQHKTVLCNRGGISRQKPNLEIILVNNYAVKLMLPVLFHKFSSSVINILLQMASSSSATITHDEFDQEEAPPTLKDFAANLLKGNIIEESAELLTVYREEDEFEDSDSDESDIVVEPAPHEEEVVEDAKTKKFGHTVKGEITLDDLPPVERLQITVAQDLLVHVGELYSFVDCLVVVESTGDHPVLNLDTALFLGDGRAVGLIFDVIGPVKRPYYVLRFNNSQEIADEHLEKGTKIFYANGHDKTFFVFEKQIRELMQMKGSDASWEHDIEPPEHELDYSNDEEEKAAKQERRAKRHLNGQLVDRRGSKDDNNNNSNGSNNNNGSNNYRNRRKSRADILSDDGPSTAGPNGSTSTLPRRHSQDFRPRLPLQQQSLVRRINVNNRNNFRNRNPMGVHHSNMTAQHSYVMPYPQAYPQVAQDPWSMSRGQYNAVLPMPQPVYGPGTNCPVVFSGSPYIAPQFPPGVQFLHGAQFPPPLYMAPPPAPPPSGQYPGPYQVGQPR